MVETLYNYIPQQTELGHFQQLLSRLFYELYDLILEFLCKAPILNRDKQHPKRSYHFHILESFQALVEENQRRSESLPKENCLFGFLLDACVDLFDKCLFQVPVSQSYWVLFGEGIEKKKEFLDHFDFAEDKSELACLQLEQLRNGHNL